MSAEDGISRALVLGGGGVTGIAWLTGILTALQEEGIDVTGADLVVGTSAGSVVAAQITGGTSLEELYELQLADPGASGERAATLDLAVFEKMIRDVMQETGMDPQALRAGIGRRALDTVTVPEATRVEVINKRLPVKEWPDRNLLLNVVDTASGDWQVFDRNSGVSLVEAVAASCAVPLVWPPVTINGRRYMDGGMRSATNADLAKGYKRVLILVPIPEVEGMPPIFGSNLAAEKALLAGQGSRVMVIQPSEAAEAATGQDRLNPARRAAVARAGLAQGSTLGEVVREFWLGEAAADPVLQ